MTDRLATEKKSPIRSALGVVGFGAAACAACCIGPIVAFLGSVGVLGVLSTPIFGVAGLVVALVAAAALVAVRRRHRITVCSVEAGPVPVVFSSRESVSG